MSDERRRIVKRSMNYAQARACVGVSSFFFAVQIALVFTAAKETDIESCFNNPASPNCKNADEFYPSQALESDMDSLCSMMPWMAGCSVRRACQAGDATGKYCSPWSLLADMCSTEWGETMDGMMGCKNYTALCRKGTAVQQCRVTEDKGIPFLVPTATAISDTLALCTQMPDMTECKACTKKGDPGKSCPDPLKTLSEICLAMDMSDCKHWNTMCEEKPEGIEVFCGAMAPGECSGMMQMYFHNGLQDYVLFRDWVPCTPERYHAAVAGVFLASVFAVLLKVLRFRMERRMSARRRLNPTPRREGLMTDLLGGASEFPNAANIRARRDDEADSSCGLPAEATLFPSSMAEMQENAVRAAFVGVTMTLDYGLMLIAMTFNYGLFFAVVSGAMFGALLFGHAGQREQRGRRPLGGPGTAALEDRACCQNT